MIRTDSAPDPFLGSCPALSEFLARLRRAAESDSTVLLVGESGSGKSRAAARLHGLSPRARGPFVAASLMATSSTLIEATLFGHERGAFTDAHKGRLGIFRRAHGGTVLLDDIEHLPLETQVKLLRVLQERVVEPLGAEASVPVDVRVVLPIEVPPLRVRLDDLAALAEGLIEAVAERVGVVPRPLAPEALARLRQHGWPGNVRELENALERVLVLRSTKIAPESPIQAEELDFLDQASSGAADELARKALALGLTVDDVARAMMERALREHRGNVSAAARSVGLTRRAFYYRIGRSDLESDLV